jgi:type IV secretory pathway TrbD component
MSRTLRSPDGRSWTLERARPESALAAAKKEPVFWGSVAVTAVTLGIVVWVTIEFGVGAIFIVTVVLFLIWLFERGLNAARPNLQAHTDGPPAQTLTWRTTHRYGLSRIEDRVATQIEHGQLEDEPAGTVLIGI